MKLMITILMLAVCATGAWAQQTVTFGWEDGVSTHLGTSGNVGDAINTGDFFHTGERSLYMFEDPVDGTPEVYVAWIADLQDGDQVTVSYWTWDDTEGGSPSSRIWGHYTTNDITVEKGSASGPGDYSPGTGWSEQGHTWTIDAAADPERTGLVVEFRMYSATDLVGPYYCDDLTVTAPDHALIFIPDMIPVSDVDSSFGSVKALFR